mmetsp:Transcript_34836/g.100126  ORF Transcript_34836/g.100126 Transcript_34836/m.100126 type:complete len:212 (+) Transcript_34836:433-1068(+)
MRHHLSGASLVGGGDLHHPQLPQGMLGSRCLTLEASACGLQGGLLASAAQLPRAKRPSALLTQGWQPCRVLGSGQSTSQLPGSTSADAQSGARWAQASESATRSASRAARRLWLSSPAHAACLQRDATRRADWGRTSRASRSARWCDWKSKGPSAQSQALSSWMTPPWTSWQPRRTALQQSTCSLRFTTQARSALLSDAFLPSVKLSLDLA